MLRQDIDRTRGYFTNEDKAILFTIYQPGTTLAQVRAATATPQNVSGWELSWILKRCETDDDTEALIVAETGGAVVITDGANGEITVTLDHQDIEHIHPNVEYWHELMRVDTGFRTVLVNGRFMLNQGVHQNPAQASPGSPEP